MENITGKQLGPYQVIAPLGEGGMAAVYKAYQPGVERDVALKILPRHFATDPQFVARFGQEAKMLAQLQHPHILPIFDFGESDGYTYIVMPLLKNGDLNDLIKVKPVSSNHIRQVATQVGDALAYAHQHGVVHRDVKPSNVLLDESGNCLLTDFGIAKLVESSTNLTATGGIVGTPTYMSPEQGLGQKLDGRSDIYSLGIIMYEMATGRVPYRAETPLAVVIKHINDPLPPPRQANANIPEKLEKVILKAVAKKPEDRYQTATELVKAVKLVIPEDVVMPPVTVLTPLLPDPNKPESEEVPPKKTGMAWGLALGAILLGGVGLLLAAGAGAWFIAGSTAKSTVIRVAEVAATLPPATSATPTPIQSTSTRSPANPAPVVVPEAATTSPPMPSRETEPGEKQLPANPGMACLGSFGQGVTCLDELGRWQTYTKENSPLGSNLVQAMAACPDERIAIAHSSGLSVFNGQDWREYEPGWQYTSPSNIVCDSENNFWVTHFGGVSHFDGSSWTTYDSEEFAANGESGALVDTVALAPDGAVWVSSSNSISRFDGNEWQVFEMGHGFDRQYFFKAVTVDKQGRPWATYGGGIFEYNGQSWTGYEHRDLFVTTSIAVDPAGEVWVGTYSQGIRIFDGQGGWRSLELGQGRLSSNHVAEIEVDAQGRLWIATDWGLNVVNGSGWQTYHMHNAGLADNDIRSLAVAGAGPLLPLPLEKEPGALTGQLVRRDGTPLANAPLEVCVSRILDWFSSAAPCAGQPYIRQTTTNTTGKFEIGNLPAGYYRITVNDPQSGWFVMNEYAPSLGGDNVLIETGQQTDLLQVMVTPPE